MNRKQVIWILAVVLITALLTPSLLWVGGFFMTRAEKQKQIEDQQQAIIKAVFPCINYTNLLQRFKNLGYRFVQPRDYNSSLTGKICVIVHDVDFRWEGAAILSSIERDFGIKSAFFLRVDANYYNDNIAISFFKDLQEQGWEIGIHYDCLSRNDGDQQAALSQYVNQISLIRQTFNVSDSRYHGDVYNLNIHNDWLYGNHTQVWQDLHLREASSTSMTELFYGWSYISDSNGKWKEPQQLGDHVLINLHADWW